MRKGVAIDNQLPPEGTTTMSDISLSTSLAVSAPLVSHRTLTPTVAKPLLPALTGLRIFAAVHVVLTHFAMNLIVADRLRLKSALVGHSPLLRHASAIVMMGLIRFVGGASASVSLFFVLSGFILAYNYLDPDCKRSTSPRQFWVARLGRIGPAYWLAWFIMMPWAIQSLYGHSSVIVSARGIGRWLLPLMSVTATHAWAPNWALDWNSPSWSLCSEALFYVMFPVLFLAVPPRRMPANRARLWQQVGLWLGMAMLIPIAYAVFQPDGAAAPQSLTAPGVMWLRAVAFFPLCRVPEFLAGVALGRLFLLDQKTGHTAPRWLAPLALVLFVFILAERPGIPYAMVAGGGLAPLFAALIYGLAHGGRLARWLSGSLLVLLGEASYGVYILHVPIFECYRYAIEHLHQTKIAVTGWPFFAGFFCLTLLLSMMSFKYFETPARAWIRSLLNPRQRGKSAPTASGASSPQIL